MSDTEKPPYRTLFVVGCPRSGTTWMQLLLDQCPAVATAPETQIFAYYLDRFRRQWAEEHEGATARLQGRAGLSRLLSEEEFLELCGVTAGFVLDRIHARNPAAPWVMEKSPRHALLVDFILRVFPDASILHVIRDPRDTAASLIRAGRSWGQSWAPRNPIEAGRLWKQHVEAGRGARDLTQRYHEVRYEDLRRDTAAVFAGVLDWLDLPVETDFVEQAVRACDLQRLKKDSDDSGRPVPGGRSPQGFFGKGSVGGWRDVLGTGGGRQVESVCHDLMQSLGYAPELVQSGKKTLRIAAHDGIRRVRDSVDWRFQQLLFRI